MKLDLRLLQRLVNDHPAPERGWLQHDRGTHGEECWDWIGRQYEMERAGQSILDEAKDAYRKWLNRP